MGLIKPNRFYLFVLPVILFTYLVPFFVREQYVLHLLITYLLYLTLAQSWNLLAGYSGLLSLAQQLFFGVGAYTAALTLVGGMGHLVAVLAAVAICALVAYSSSLALIRLRGVAFAIASWMLAEAARTLAHNYGPLGGSAGIVLPVTLMLDKVAAYYTILSIAIVSMIALYLLITSKHGLALRAMLEDETSAERMGINTAFYKKFVLSISGGMAGAAGSFYTFYVLYIEPDTAFSFIWSIDAIIITVLGGIGTLIGPVIGMLPYLFVIEYLRLLFQDWNILLVGAFLLALSLGMRKGIRDYLVRLLRVSHVGTNQPL